MKFKNDSPIYLQVKEDLKERIYASEFGLEEKIPSIRELSLYYTVTPVIVQRSMTLLIEEGLVYTVRGKGNYVTSDSKLIKNSKKEDVDKLVLELEVKLEALEISKKEFIKILKEKK